VGVAHVEHFASQEASVPQLLGLKKHDLVLLGIAADAAWQAVA
jgi:hypothetical protein